MVLSQVMVTGLVFPESPRWHDGRLWFSDMHGQRIMTAALDGSTQIVAELDDRPSGLGFLPGGIPLAVLMAHKQLVKILDSGLEIHADLTHIPCSYLNDMVVDRHGTAYVDCVFHRGPDDATDMGDCIAIVRAEGTVAIAGVGDLIGPNGLALSPDGGSLVVAEPRARRVSKFAITSNGRLDDRRTFAQGEAIQADGLCLDAEGAVWIGAIRSGRFLRVAEGGQVLETVNVGDKWAIACVLGGPDRRTLYMTTARVPGDPVGGLTGNLNQSLGFIEIATVGVPGAGTP